ncbi:MAG: hypothetical protein HA495_03375 [Thaumarchaeota archaeon]|nr:hypothetical protein [Nitrososphaerota archaeon]
MNKATFLLVTTLLGGIIFAVTLPSLLGLIVNGPVYDVVPSETYNKTTIVIVPRQTYLVANDSKTLPPISVTPVGSNYNFSIKIYGNSTFTFSIIPSPSSSSDMGNEKTFTFSNVNSPMNVTITVKKQSSYKILSITLEASGEYNVRVPSSQRVINFFYTYIIPSLSILSLVVLLFSFYSLRKETRSKATTQSSAVL